MSNYTKNITNMCKTPRAYAFGSNLVSESSDNLMFRRDNFYMLVN